VPDWAVQRPRLTRLIAQATRWCPLTVVTGPPGAGKTMAMASWAAAESGTVAWVSLDKYDNRPAVFWSHLVAALRQSGVAVPKAVQVPGRGRADDYAFLLRLASALADRDPPTRLVVDDFHLLSEPRVLKGLDFVLRNVEPGLRLVLSSRMDPLLPLHRYRLAGQLIEVRASDLAFSVAEAGVLLERHDITLTADSLECLARRTEGWAAGLRLAAISMGSHPDPDQFVKELAAENSALTAYLVDEVLSTQPPETRDVLLSTSILDHVSADAANELAGNRRAAGILSGLARANAFVEPTGSDCYRCHTLFAEVLRLKLRHERPDRVATLHRRAARWYERNGMLTDAVRHAAEAGDWQLAARMVVDGLAIGEIMEPRGSSSLADEFRRMPSDQPWTQPQPYLVAAAVELSDGRPEYSAAALRAAEGAIECLPAGQEAASRLAAAMIRLTASLRTGDLAAAAAAAASAEAVAGMLPAEELARHPEIRTCLSARGTVELWSGHLDEAASVLDSEVAAATAAGRETERADRLGHLALTEALRGHLRRAARLATMATAHLTDGQHPPVQDPPVQHPNPAALVALALVHLEHNELREARNRLEQADAALGVSPDALIGAVACLVAACGGLAEGRAEVAAQTVARARSGWSVPAWLDRRLSLTESLAYAAAGDTRAGLAAADRAGGDDSPEAAVTLAHAWLAAGDSEKARRALAPALAVRDEMPERVRLQAWLVDARLSYGGGYLARGRRSLAAALRLAEPERLRLPFALERSWIEPVLRHDRDLAGAHRWLFGPAQHDRQFPAPLDVPSQAAALVVEPLTEREREVLRLASGMLSSAEIASQMFISVNTVKTHLKSIFRKLGVAHRGEAVRRARQLDLI
jgi:LuxR family transcriptional regulator, maltose regulon positive regulatory protein